MAFSDPFSRCPSHTLKCRCHFGYCSCWNTSQLSRDLPSVPHNKPSFKTTWIVSLLLSWYEIRTDWAGSTLCMLYDVIHCIVTMQCTCVDAFVLVMFLCAFTLVFRWFVTRLCWIYYVVMWGVCGPACTPHQGAPCFVTPPLRCRGAVCSANVLFFCFCISPVCVAWFAFLHPCILEGNILSSRPLSTQPAWAMISECVSAWHSSWLVSESEDELIFPPGHFMATLETSSGVSEGEEHHKLVPE